MTDAPAPAAAAAAAALLWGKILADQRSRAAFAQQHRGHPDAVVFDQPGALTFKTSLSSATLPYAALRALPAPLPVQVAVRGADLLCTSLAGARLEERAGAERWSELRDWTASLIGSLLARFRTIAPIDSGVVAKRAALLVGSFVPSFGRSFGRSFGGAVFRSMAREIVRDFVLNLGRDSFRNFRRVIFRSFGRSFGSHLFGQIVNDFVTDFIRNFGQSFVRDFARDFVREFNRNFGQSFVRDLARELGIDAREPGWEIALDRAMGDDVHQLRLLERREFWRLAILSSSTGEVDLRKRAIVVQAELGNPLALSLLFADIWNAAAENMLLASFRYVTAYLEDKWTGDALETWLLHNPLEIYANAFAWEEHCKALHEPSGPAASLIIAHAAYATLMTGLECKLPFTPDLTDPAVRVSLLLYELCNFRDAAANVQKLEQEIASPAPELRPLLEAAGLLAPSAANTSGTPAPIDPPAEPIPDPGLPASDPSTE
jgi:hypothetical protein